MQTLTLSTIVLDNDARAANDLAGVTIPVNLAKTSPGTENLGVTDLDEVDFVLGAEGLDELEVLCLGVGLDEDAEVGLAFVEGFGAFAEAAGEAVVKACVENRTDYLDV